MSIQNVGIKAYKNALNDFTRAQKRFQEKADLAPRENPEEASFASTLNSSLKEVNDLQSLKRGMIEAFASGETQNVHELMITLQKAGLAVNMTSAVRNKVLEAYKELSRIQF